MGRSFKGSFCYYINMWKILPATVVVALIIGAAIYLIFFKNSPQTIPAQVKLEGFDISPNTSLNDRVANLEKAVNILAKQAIKNSKTGEKFENTQDVLDNSLEGRIAVLENQMNTLQNQDSSNNTLTSNQTTPQTSNTPQVVYIPLGSGGSSGDRNYITMPTYQVAINPADYSGYTSMQLEVNMGLIQSVGSANAQLFNSTSNLAVGSSQVSTTASPYAWVTSTGFTLPAGNNTYVLQLQSTQGYTINVQNARIKVNY